LRRDNERFVRLIDSGEWGRGRVAELVGAGEVLKGERDALLKLIQVGFACVRACMTSLLVDENGHRCFGGGVLLLLLLWFEALHLIQAALLMNYSIPSDPL